MMKRLLAFALLVGLALTWSGCSKIPSEDLCKSSCNKLIELMGGAKRAQLSSLPQGYKEKYDAKVGTEGKAIVDECIANCKVEGSIAAAECLAIAKTYEDVARCRSEFSQ
jgi:hypothetical protein